MSVIDRLAELGVALPDVPTPAGTYVPATRSGDLIFTSGQLPIVGGQLQETGQVGDRPEDVSIDDAARCAVTCVLAALAAAADVAGGIERIGGVVRVTGYVNASPDFTAHPSVLNPASALLGEIFGEAGRHSRAAVGVASLPLGSPVEVDLVVTLRE